jgi:hypothetical protein
MYMAVYRYSKSYRLVGKGVDSIVGSLGEGLVALCFLNKVFYFSFQKIRRILKEVIVNQE